MKKTIIRISLVLLVIGVLYFLFGAASNASASSKAEKICESIHPGMTVHQVEKLSLESGGWFRSVDKDMGSAGANGWSLICKCAVKSNDGAVIGVSKSLCIY